jgi:FAD/FMN-containing dehydrogenase
LGSHLIRERNEVIELSPSSERELADVFAALRERPPQLGERVRLSLARFASAPAFDERSLTVHCDAGVPLVEVETLARQRRLSLGPLAPGAWQLTVGAFVEHPAHAYRPTALGRLEPVAERVRAVLADGHLVADGNAGPDLSGLVIGAGRALGVVTRATLRLVRTPERSLRHLYRFETHGQAIEAVRESLAAGVIFAHLTCRRRGGQWACQIVLEESAKVVLRWAAQFERCAERAGGHFEGEGCEAEVDDAEREVSWHEVGAALAGGASVQLFRVAQDSVMARGTDERRRMVGGDFLKPIFDERGILESLDAD